MIHSWRKVIGSPFTTQGHGLSKNQSNLSSSFCLFSLMCRLRSLPHPEPACTGKWECRSSKPFALVILHWERANKVFGKRWARLLNDLHHGSSSIQVRRCGESSFATPSAALRLQDHLRPVSAIHLPEGKDSIRTLLFNPALKHAFWDHDHVVSYCLYDRVVNDRSSHVYDLFILEFNHAIA